MKYSVRRVISICKTPISRGGYRWNLHSYADLFVDWALFAMLVTTEHSVLALTHVSSLILQYVLGRAVRKSLVKIVATFDDPLEVEGKVDMDALMDKLCDPNPDSKNDQDT